MKPNLMAIAIAGAYRPFFSPVHMRAAERIQAVMLFRAAYQGRLSKVRDAFAKKETYP